MNNILKYIKDRKLEDGEAMLAKNLLMQGCNPDEVDIILFNRINSEEASNSLYEQGVERANMLLNMAQALRQIKELGGNISETTISNGERRGNFILNSLKRVFPDINHGHGRERK
jgi:hypothetical protein